MIGLVLVLNFEDSKQDFRCCASGAAFVSCSDGTDSFELTAVVALGAGFITLAIVFLLNSVAFCIFRKWVSTLYL